MNIFKKKPIKIKVDFTYQKWTGAGFKDEKESTILTYLKRTQVTKENIENSIILKTQSSRIVIDKFTKI